MSTGDLLSKVALSFKDPDLSRIYSREKTEFFSKAIPVVASMMLLLAGSLEVIYRIVFSDGDLPAYNPIERGRGACRGGRIVQGGV